MERTALTHCLDEHVCPKPLAKKLLAANVLLESLCNTKGKREFVTVTDLYFDQQNEDKPAIAAHLTTLCSATAPTTDSTVIRPIFYALYHGASDTTAQELRLRSDRRV